MYWLQVTNAVLCPQAMSLRDDQEFRPFFRKMVVGLVIAVSTVSADLAAFSGHADTSRLALFALAGLSAAASGVVALGFKKNLLSL